MSASGERKDKTKGQQVAGGGGGGLRRSRLLIKREVSMEKGVPSLLGVNAEETGGQNRQN